MLLLGLPGHKGRAVAWGRCDGGHTTFRIAAGAAFYQGRLAKDAARLKEE